MVVLALLIQDPLGNDYNAFFSHVLSHLPKSASGIDVLVGNSISGTGELNQILLSLYPQIRAIASLNGFSHRFEIDVLVNSPVNVAGKSAFCLEDEISQFKITDSVETVSVEIEKRETVESIDTGYLHKSFATSAVGGTFDHLHDGHKILLLMTAFTASKSIIIGVTGPKLLVNKKFAKAMEPLHDRVMNVCKFLQKIISPGISVQIYQINDVCGPTGFVKAIDALVISEETVKGAEFVNNYRKERGFPALEVVTVKVIGGDGSGNASNNWKGKLSSTDIREEECKRLHLE